MERNKAVFSATVKEPNAHVLAQCIEVWEGETMPMDSPKTISDASRVVAGLFTNLSNAKDAISDLASAGFSASQINVAYASDAERGISNSHGGSDMSSVEHSIPWKLKESFEKDLYRQGASQIAGEGGANLHRVDLYTDADLREALTEIGVAPDRILLLEREIGDGVLLLVNAADHSDKAEEIVERNEGTIRTDTVTERAPKIV